ncbi:MAG: TonB-dependent receptor [Alphaproteobacteria bacterium]|nr:MAG: TonB-dependent receptor [Alphaproteobacteria bacterium]
MKRMLRGASCVAMMAVILQPLSAWAQQQQSTSSAPEVITPAQPPSTAPDADDRVVITGSLIAGSPEDAALPVEVFSAEDLEKQGSPTALEFAKNLTISGPTSGEANFFGGNPGSVSFNLRGIGSDKTLTLLNGHRVAANANFIPGAALERTELLKDGAAVTYGADAIGGVVNFITRKNFVGLEARANYKYIDGSDGDYNASLLTGFGEGDTNFLMSVEYERRSPLPALERDWATTPRSTNIGPWSSITNLGFYSPRGVLPTGPLNPSGAGGQFTLTDEWGPSLGAAVRDNANSVGTPAQNCSAIGGAYTTACQFNYYNFYNIVEPTDIYRAYAQLNTSINDDTNFHIDVAYGQVRTVQHISPSVALQSGPAANSAEQQIFIPVTNPYVSQFMSDAGYTPSAGLSGFAFGSAPTGAFYRVFAFGGSQAYGENTIFQEYDSQGFRASSGLNGRLGDWAGPLGDINYDVTLNYDQTITRTTYPDIIGFRLQEALQGFGGPNCNAQDLNPNLFGTQNTGAAGQNGCMWFNPFVTGFRSNPALNMVNPQSGTVRNLALPAGVSSWENPVELQRWLYDDKEQETVSSALTLDVVFNGLTPVELPGGTVAWALGFQGRQLESREFVPSPYNNDSVPCSWPGQEPALPGTAGYTGCNIDRPGPLVYTSTNYPDRRDQQQRAAFGELQLPILDNFNISAAVRREEFSGGLGSTVYKISGKWDVWGPISLRGSYGTNYQAPPITLRPGEVNNGVANYTRAGGLWLPATQITRSDVVPATATAWNAGVIWQSEGFSPDHNFRFIVDYFSIETENEFRQLATYNQIFDSVWNATDSYTPCDHPLASRIAYQATATSPGGICSATTVPTDLGRVTTEYGNGPGIITNGFDYQIDYSMPVGPGDFMIGASATQLKAIEDTAVNIDGFQIFASRNRLGNLNQSGSAQAAPEWKVNAFATYSFDQHTFRFGADWASAVYDDRVGIQYGENGEDPIYFDLVYLFDLSDTLRLTASIDNITDRDPPKHQMEPGYDPRQGSPLGRTIEVGIKKVF